MNDFLFAFIPLACIFTILLVIILIIAHKKQIFRKKQQIDKEKKNFIHELEIKIKEQKSIFDKNPLVDEFSINLHNTINKSVSHYPKDNRFYLKIHNSFLELYGGLDASIKYIFSNYNLKNLNDLQSYALGLSILEKLSIPRKLKLSYKVAHEDIDHDFSFVRLNDYLEHIYKETFFNDFNFIKNSKNRNHISFSSSFFIDAYLLGGNKEW